MLEGKELKIGKYYIYVFDKSFDNEFKNKLILDSEQRFMMLKELVCPEFHFWKRPYYVIEFSEKEPRGYAYSGMLKCEIPTHHKEDLPMVHEETHMVVYQMLGEMSYAWSEGFAEYYVCMLNNSINYLAGENADFAKLNSQAYLSEIIYSLTHEDTEHFNWLRRHNMFYSMSLASFIHYVRLKLGERDFIHLIKMVVGKDYEALKKYVQDILVQWFQWVENGAGILREVVNEI